MSKVNPERRDWDGDPVLRHTKDGSHVGATRAMKQGSPQRNNSGQIIDTYGKPVQRHVKSPASSGSGGNSQLRAEKRMDSTGKIVTRWVKDGPVSGTSAALAGHTAVGTGTKNPVPTNVNWDTTSSANAEHLATMVGYGLGDPDKLWSNFDFYTGMLESKHSDIALDAVVDDNVGTALRDTWLKMHGLGLEDHEDFENVGGDEGFDAFRSANAEYTTALAAAKKGLGADVPVPSYYSQDPDASNPSGFAAQQARENEEYRLEQINKRSRALQDDTQAVPSDVEGAVFEWSSLNPFKRRKK